MSVRPTFFIDRSLGKGVGIKLREAGALVELHDDHYPQTSADVDWIPAVSSRGWVILTKDKNIRRSRGERADLIAANARVFTLTSGNMTGATMAHYFIVHLDDMERLCESTAAPFAFAVGPRGIEAIFESTAEENTTGDR